METSPIAAFLPPNFSPAAWNNSWFKPNAFNKETCARFRKGL